MKLKLICATAFPLLAMMATGAQAQNISVQVNGNPVAFDNAGPIEQNDTVLVPLRGVFEALGATVDYDSASQSVHAYRGGQQVVLTIGSSQATVGDQTVALSQPATVVGGSTMVPLRFVAQSLGARVDWDGSDQTVRIHTDDAAVTEEPSTGIDLVRGHLVRVIRLGDGSQVLKLDTGTSVTLAPGARISMNGNPIGVDEIQPYERVAIRVNGDNEGVRVFVNPGNGAGPERAPETIGAGLAPEILAPADGALVGQHVTLTGRAYPGATVRLIVRYAGKSNGGGYDIHGTQTTRDIVADASGNWATTIHLDANADNLDDDTVHYTIAALTVRSDGTMSPTDTINVGGGRVYAHRRLQ
jgi:hypothetical protein